MQSTFTAGGISVNEDQPNSLVAAGFRQPLQMAQAWETALEILMRESDSNKNCYFLRLDK